MPTWRWACTRPPELQGPVPLEAGPSTDHPGAALHRNGSPARNGSPTRVAATKPGAAMAEPPEDRVKTHFGSLRTRLRFR